MLRKDRAYSAAVILTLAICLGANTAIFTVVRSVLLRPLPYPESGRLAFMFDGFPGAGVERAGTSVPNYLDRVPLHRRLRFGGAVPERRVPGGAGRLRPKASRR